MDCFSQKEFKFKHLSTKEGLSNNNVSGVIQDKRGFLWFGTASGLNRYDGYSFKVFDHKEDDSTSLSDNRIRALAEDKDGKIWIGTSNGLNCFDPVTEQFSHFLFTEKDVNTLSDNRITTILMSHENIMWIGTENGLNRFDPITFKNTRFTSNLRTQIAQPNKQITSIAEDADGAIWIGLWWGGLKKIDPKTLAIQDLFAEPGKEDGISNNNVLSVFADNDNSLWIVCYMGGIKKMDLHSHEFHSVFGFEKTAALGILTQDNSGNIWISAGPGIVAIYNPKNRTTFYKYNIPNDPTTISSGSISAIHCDKTGIVWITTDKDISYYDPQGEKFVPYFRQINSEKRDYCRTFYQDKNNQLWIGIWDLGLVRYNTTTREFRLLKHNNADPYSINNDIINGIFSDKSGKIWVATYNGICILDPHTCKVVKKMFYSLDSTPALLNGVNAHVTSSKSGFFWVGIRDSLLILDIENQKTLYLPLKGKGALSDIKITCIISDKKGDLWIGTEFYGLNHFQTSNGRVTTYINKSSDSTTISSNTINDIVEDHDGNLWIATQNGLNRFDSEKGKFYSFKKNQGLSANECISVKEDYHGKIWIQNSKGLDKLDVQTRRIIKYSESNGLSLNPSGLYINDQGILFGGHSEKGFYMFAPESIPENKNVHPVYLTDFFIFNESVPISKGSIHSPLNKSILLTEKIELNHRQSVISFEFSMLNYTSSERNIYEYKLDGFDDRWYKTEGERRRITYTNLNAGNYTLRIKAANNDGYWNSKELTLKIVILPPWWKTWWAYSIYFLAIALILLIIQKYLIDKERLQHEIAIQKIEATKSFELSQMKQQFFTNISHEYRTPLTLIIGPIEKLIRILDQFDRNKILDLLQVIHRNANRLLQLTNQLLDIRKLESGSMKLEISSGDFVGFVQKIASGFLSIAEKKQIDFKIITDDSSNNSELHWFDADKVDKIISNLLSNAFKFTPENGKISLTIKSEKFNTSTENGNTNTFGEISDFWTIVVDDSGIGIPKEYLNRVFEPFYQVDNSHRHTDEGTGIGLALTKELVALHNGIIEVESEMGIGSKFTVHLPMDILKSSNYTILDAQKFDSLTPVLPNIDVVIPKDASDNINMVEKELNRDDRPIILLVEDNKDMRLYISNIIQEKYKVLKAENGIHGFELAIENLPDLIVSDVMMPEMDGYELTNKLKNDQRTSHIPIVLLTSLSSSENLIKGLENEADEYLTKPFNDQVLLLIIKNLIVSRSRLKKIYSNLIETADFSQKSLEFEPILPDIPNSEKKFLDKLMSIIELHLSDSEFDVQRFSAEIGMEASVFHRKLKAVINQSPGDFIRSRRMKRASQLLSDKSLPISEIAYLVGFGNNTNYFSTAFRKHFGKTPSEFQNS